METFFTICSSSAFSALAELVLTGILQNVERQKDNRGFNTSSSSFIHFSVGGGLAGDAHRRRRSHSDQRH